MHYISYLQGFGDKAVIETDLLTVQGDWCVDYGVKLNNARAKTSYTRSNGSSGWSSLFDPG